MKKETETANKPSGIVFGSLNLIYSSFVTNSEFKGNLDIPTPKILYRYRIENGDQSKLLLCQLELSLFENLRKKWPFKFRAIYQASFKTVGDNQSLPIEQFAEHQAPAFVMPYIRELLSNLSNRSIYPVLNLPPVNLLNVMQTEPL
jgi:preprotein translocase subunit SecB